MPQALPAFIIAVVDVVVAVFGPKLGIFLLDLGIKLAATSALSSLYAKIAGEEDFSDTIEGTTITTRETLAHQRVIYGETLVSGPLWFMDAAGENNRELHMGIVIAGHRVEAMTDIWLDDKEIPEAAIGWGGTGAVNSGDFRGDVAQDPCAYFYQHKGEQTAASTILTAKFSQVTSGHIGTDIAWLHARFDYFKEQAQVWSAGSPNNIKVLTKGRRVYDPRSDSSQSFGTGPHRVNSYDTYEYNPNNALCWADYMVDPDLCFGEAPARVDYGYVASAANVCDAVVFTPVGTDVRFACHGVLSTGDTYANNLERILASFNGTASMINGLWKLRAWGWETPVSSITDDMLISDVQIKLHVDDRERYNRVRGYYVNPDKNWQASQFPTAISAEYLARDDDEKLYRDIQLHMTKDPFMAQRLAFGILEQSDQQATVVFPGNYRVMPTEIGGTVMYANDKLEWDNKHFRAIRYKFVDGGGIGLVFREDDASAYVDVATNEYTTITSQGTYIAASPGVPTPNSMTIDNTQGGILIGWQNPAARLYDFTEVYRSIDSNWLNATLIAESRITDYLDIPPQDEINFYFLRSRNYAGDVSSYIPVGSSAFGVFVNPTMVLASDPTFNQSRARVGIYGGLPGSGTQGIFWKQSSYQQQTISGKNVSYRTQVHSAGTGTGSSSIMRTNFWIGSDHSGLVAENIDNRRQVPIIRGHGVTKLVRYRVTSYSNVLSAQLQVVVLARKQLHDISATGLASPLIISIPNSIGWTVASKFSNIAGASNIGSFSYVSLRLQPNVSYTAADTGHLCIEFDDAYAFFNKS